MGMGISQYVIIIVSLIIFLIPVSQVDAIFFFSPEISDEEFSKKYKELQKFKMEKFRDYYFEVKRLQNPYNDKISDNVIIFTDQKLDMQLSNYRYDENFQTLKDEQIDLAQKKYLEQLGGKSIISSLGDKPDKRIIPILEFSDEELSFMKVIHRYDEGFTSYKIQQAIIAEDYLANNWKELQWELNPYQNNESIEELSNNKENKILPHVSDHRQNEMSGFRITSMQNPYPDEKIDGNLDASISNTNQNIVISWSDPTYVTDKPEFNFLDRHTIVFEMVKAMEIEIAKSKLNEMVHLSSPEKSDTEIIILTQENKKPNNYNQHDKEFEFLKKTQIDIAEQKLIEILGGRTITNVDFKTVDKIVVIPELSKAEKIKLINRNYEILQNYNLVLLSIPDKIRAGSTNGYFWDLNGNIINENNKVKQTVVDKNIDTEKLKQRKTVELRSWAQASK